MTGDPNNFSHTLRSISTKATNIDPNYRYENATDMLNGLNSWLRIRSHESFKEKIWEKINQGIFDNDIENYIYEMSEKNLCLSCINKGTRFTECLLSFMNLDDSHATYIIQKIDSNYAQYIKRFEDADPFASLAYEILKGHFSYNVNEVAAYILKYVAYDINRFNTQHKIERLINKGVEPLIETILER